MEKRVKRLLKKAICFVGVVGAACDVRHWYDSAGLLRLPRSWTFLNSLILIAILFSMDSFAKTKKHPYDIYDHEMHMGLFEMASVSCELCHADPDSYGDRKKVNPMGCHTCHNSPNPPLEATKTCTLCHVDGPPKPQSHKVEWIGRHQTYAKQNVNECKQCHTQQMFCVDCHTRRDTVQERMHKRNFRFFHSIEARANPRKCDACHTVNYCQECHAGRGSSKR